MSGRAAGSRRRRQRSGRNATYIRRTPEQLNQPVRRPRFTMAQALACAAVGVIGLSLIALIWLNTDRSIKEQTDDQRARVEAAITAQATTLGLQAQRELLMIDQSLTVLQAAWDENPDGFKLDDWRKKMPALTAVADDLFIANEHHVIVQDIVPSAIGQGIGSAYGNFVNGTLEPLQPDDSVGHDKTMLLGELGSGAVIRQFIMYLVRPLGKPPGWLIGASYRSQTLANVFATAGLGPGGLAALIDTHRGGVQALAGTAAVHPRLVIGNTPMYRAMLARPDGGVWVGATPIDGVDRIIAFHPVPARDLIVAVGVRTDLAMGPAQAWAASANAVAAIASLLVLAITGIMLWEIWHWRRNRYRQRALAQAQGLLSGVQTELGVLRLRAAASETEVKTLLGMATNGVAIADAENRLAAWSPRFVALSLLPPAEWHEGLPLETLLRTQMTAGPAALPVEAENEIAERLALLRTGDTTLAWNAPDGSAWTLHALVLPDSSLLLVLREGASLAETGQGQESASADPVEW